MEISLILTSGSCQSIPLLPCAGARTRVLKDSDSVGSAHAAALHARGETRDYLSGVDVFTSREGLQTYNTIKYCSKTSSVVVLKETNSKQLLTPDDGKRGQWRSADAYLPLSGEYKKNNREKNTIKPPQASASGERSRTRSQRRQSETRKAEKRGCFCYATLTPSSVASPP